VDAETAVLMARLATLTPRQVCVLMLRSEGRLNKQIAYELTVSEATVTAHVSARIEPRLFAVLPTVVHD
jgi:DNA-binding NarL/FixJ family response regulator